MAFSHARRLHVQQTRYSPPSTVAYSPKNELNSAFRLYLTVRARFRAPHSLATVDEALLVYEYASLSFDLQFDAEDGVVWFDFKRGRPSSEGFDEDSHS